MIFKLTEREFFLANDTTSIQLEAIWLGGANLPPNGTSVVASGQIVKGPDGPVMMCDQLSPSGDSAATFDNPWVLPALRFLAPALIWFLLMVLATGILSLIHLGKPARLGRNRMVAVAEMSTVAGAAVMIPVTALFFLERALGGLVGGLHVLCLGSFRPIAPIRISASWREKRIQGHRRRDADSRRNHRIDWNFLGSPSDSSLLQRSAWNRCDAILARIRPDIDPGHLGPLPARHLYQRAQI